METKVYLTKAGVKVAVFHRNASGLAWQHPYDRKAECGACQGTSTAAPKETR